jgi:ferredoxin
MPLASQEPETDPATRKFDPQATRQRRPGEGSIAMKIVIDYDLCEANAVCMDVCPECFRVEEDDTLTVLIESPPDNLRAKVEEAVRLCPRQAISLAKD